MIIEPTILTYSGRVMDLSAPAPDMIHLEDIAHALSHICRFTGHVKHFYSVAQEAYIGDVSSPLKRMLTEYRRIEAQMEDAISQRFDINFSIGADRVKHADLLLLATERRDNFSHLDSLPDWNLLKTHSPLDMHIDPWPAEVAKRAFLDRAHELGIQ